jgi:hypothetical protein
VLEQSSRVTIKQKTKKLDELVGSEEIIVARESDILIKNNDKPRTWSSEKAAVQWIRRQAEKNKEDVEIIKLDGNSLYACFQEPIQKNPQQHKWKKVNVMALGDRRGRYNKLVCVHCGLTIRHYYTRERHFYEEFRYCKEKNT